MLFRSKITIKAIFILLSFVLPTLGFLFLSVINIALIVILYSGISNLKEKKSYDPYSFAITYTIANFLTTYIIINDTLSKVSPTEATTIY